MQRAALLVALVACAVAPCRGGQSGASSLDKGRQRAALERVQASRRRRQEAVEEEQRRLREAVAARVRNADATSELGEAGKAGKAAEAGGGGVREGLAAAAFESVLDEKATRRLSPVALDLDTLLGDPALSAEERVAAVGQVSRHLEGAIGDIEGVISALQQSLEVDFSRRLREIALAVDELAADTSQKAADHNTRIKSVEDRLHGLVHGLLEEQEETMRRGTAAPGGDGRLLLAILAAGLLAAIVGAWRYRAFLKRHYIV